MGDTNDDFFQELRQEFAAESSELLDVIEAEVLAHEKDGHGEHVREVQRCLHSLKGSSQAVGYSDFSRLVHDFESRLEKTSLLKSDPVKCRTLMLRCVDELRTLGQRYFENNSVKIKEQVTQVQVILEQL